ncbi:MAG TPA: hypothetical protein PLS50_07840 [Candidatus Dojkabacteria bacterium]|nr:hypothetical protein [Candidatus Dojkabacteria bacterium]
MSRNYCEYKVVENEAQASYRFNQFSSKDPLPDLLPALLNSGDIHDYARITSMVFPFYENKLKSASYEVDFLGDVYYAGENGEEISTKIGKDSPFILRKNSIVFLYTETKFFLPDYIAIRFNLKITHVHRGLLLGTGPLVDPGFVGRLLIPLHNLTSEDYKIYGGEGLIWVDFTKLSPHKDWSGFARKDSAGYKSFPENKVDLPAQKYFNKASSGKPASSSIPGEVRKAHEIAIDSQKKVQELEKELNKKTNIALITFVLSVVALVYTSWSLIATANQNISNSRDELRRMQDELHISEKKVRILEDKVELLSKRIFDNKKNHASEK